MTSLRAGVLNRRIRIQAPSATLDAFGIPAPGWTDLLTVWGAIEPLTGRELFNAQQVASEVTHRITIRFNALLTDTRLAATYRVLYAGRSFNIHAVMNEDEANVTMVMLASEGLNDGQ